MFHSQLDTFMTVAEEESFSGAAQKLYITPSAVIQQINHLERDIQVKLFERSRRGLTLTPAGQCLYEEVPRMKASNKKLHEKLLRLNAGGREEIRVGVPRFHESRLFFQLWNEYTRQNPDARAVFVEPASNEPRAIGSAYASMDLMEYMNDGAGWQKELEFLELCRIPIACAVPQGHRLAGRDLLTVEDMVGEVLVVARDGFLENLSRVNRQAAAAGVLVREVPAYTNTMVNQCVLNGDLIQVPYCARKIHPSVETVLCNWDLDLPYGFFYQKNPRREVAEFLAYVRGRLKEGPLTLLPDGPQEKRQSDRQHTDKQQTGQKQTGQQQTGQ